MCDCLRPTCPECTPVDPCLECEVTPACENCEDPVYTNEGCFPALKSECMQITSPANICIPTVNPMSFNGWIAAVTNYIKGTVLRITNTDGSITLTPIDDACDDKVNIKVKISPQVNNALVLNVNGLYVSPSQDGGIQNVAILDTNSIDLNGNGALIALSANVRKDITGPNVNNILQIGVNGLYVPPPPAQIPLVLDPINTQTLTTSLNGLLNEREYIDDIQQNMAQHFEFEVPPLKVATFETPGPIINNAFKLVLAQGTSYATNYTSANPNVKVFWGDTGTLENSLDNVIGVSQGLEHIYLALANHSKKGFVKGYNGNYLTKLVSGTGTALSGFKFHKGGEFMTSITLGTFGQGTSGTFDMKGLYNLLDYSYLVTNRHNWLTVYNELPTNKYDNMQDLLQLTSFVHYGNVTKNQDLIFLSPTFNYLFLNFCRYLNHVQVKDKPNLEVIMDSTAINILDLQNSELKSLIIANCGQFFNGYINKMILKILPEMGNINPIYTLGSGIFDFSNTQTINITQINGVQEGTYNVAKDTQILFPDLLGDGKVKYLSIKQDFIKDEAVISLNNNGLFRGNMTFLEKNGIHSFGLNYNANYYNPTYDPLGGYGALLSYSHTLGVITTFNMGGGVTTRGFRYNTIPTITKISGPGTGFIYTVVMDLGSSNFIPGGITTPGTGYTLNQIITLSGGTALIPATVKITTIDGFGGVTSFETVTLGEYTTALPATLTHAGGFVLNTTHRWSVARVIITNGGAGYDNTSIFTTQVTTFNGTGTGTASVAAKIGIDSLKNKGWQLSW